jgi:hypothetical protein
VVDSKNGIGIRRPLFNPFIFSWKETIPVEYGGIITATGVNRTGVFRVPVTAQAFDASGT